MIRFEVTIFCDGRAGHDCTEVIRTTATIEARGRIKVKAPEGWRVFEEDEEGRMPDSRPRPEGYATEPPDLKVQCPHCGPERRPR
jgi:hypothetical protein